MTGTGTCDYKFAAQPKTHNRIVKTYERLTGKTAPIIDRWQFNGETKGPTTITYSASPNRGLLIEKYVNGRLLRINNKTLNLGKSTDKVLGIIIIITPYTVGKLHSSHAISAVKYNDTLYAFNAWGEGHKSVDNDIFNYLKNKYNCDKLLIYKGPSLQAGDPYGVCVGYATNFILEMLLKIAENKIPRRPTQLKYNDFVYQVLRTRGICFGRQCVKEETIRTQWTKLEKNLRKKANSPVFTGKILGTETVEQLKQIAKQYGVKGLSGKPKAELVSSLRKTLILPSRSNLENINFKSPTPKPKPKKASPRKDMTLLNLRKYASSQCMKGRSRYPRVANLRRFVSEYKQPVRSPINKDKIETLSAQGLRNYASRHCIKGYGKYTKKSNLRRFLVNKVTKG